MLITDRDGMIGGGAKKTINFITEVAIFNMARPPFLTLRCYILIMILSFS